MQESAVQAAPPQAEPVASSALNGLPVNQIRLELERILHSRVFVHSHRIRRFLQFVVEECLSARHHRLKEYLIGMEVFNREESFDPRVDSIVRVEARRLRAKLEEYYESEGSVSELRIHLRKGSYVPVFETASRARMMVSAATATRAWRPSVTIAPFTISDGAPVSLADDIHRHLIHHLTRAEVLQVVARQNGTASDFQLTGSLAMDGSVPRLLLQLLDSSEQSYVWSREMECPPGDLSFLDDVSIDLRRAVVTPAPGCEAVRQSANKESFTNYLQGLYALKSSKPGAFAHSRAHFSKAVELDPDYAAAWASASAAMVLSCLMEGGEQEELCTAARQAARTAMSLSDGLPESHMANGLVLSFLDWDWTAGAKELQTAICMDKSSSASHIAFGMHLACRGGLPEARAEFEEAERLDPVSLLAHFCIGWSHSLAAQYDEAISRFRLIGLLEPDFPWSWLGMGWAAAGKSAWAEAIAHFTNVSHMLQSRFLFSGCLGYCYAMNGRRDEAMRLLTRPEPMPAANYASIYLGLGDSDRAFEYLEGSARNHETSLPLLILGPEFTKVREDPRFAALRREMHIAEI
jgi:tetratricopeptide (TPR) repeat protein